MVEISPSSKELAATAAQRFSCQRPSTLAVVYVIPSFPDRRSRKIPNQDPFILLIVLTSSQNVCQRQPQRFRPVLSLQDAPSDCQGRESSSGLCATFIDQTKCYLFSVVTLYPHRLKAKGMESRRLLSTWLTLQRH